MKKYLSHAGQWRRPSLYAEIFCERCNSFHGLVSCTSVTMVRFSIGARRAPATRRQNMSTFKTCLSLLSSVSRWQHNRSSAATLLLLHEREAEENKAAEAAAPKPKPPSRLFKVILRSKSLEAEVHLRLFTDYLLRPPLLLVSQDDCLSSWHAATLH